MLDCIRSSEYYLNGAVASTSFNVIVITSTSGRMISIFFHEPLIGAEKDPAFGPYALPSSNFYCSSCL